MTPEQWDRYQRGEYVGLTGSQRDALKREVARRSYNDMIQGKHSKLARMELGMQPYKEAMEE